VSAMYRLRWALSWLVVLAVGLTPMLVYWAAGVIGRAFRRKQGGVRAKLQGQRRAQRLMQLRAE
jgi:hypothetical protein